MNPIRSSIVGLSLSCMLALAGCGNQNATTMTATLAADTAAATTDASMALTVAEGALAAYEKTPNPNQAVIKEATTLDTAARSDIVTYGAKATVAIGAAGALAEYLLTSAPGNGVTPTTVPTVSGS